MLCPQHGGGGGSHVSCPGLSHTGACTIIALNSKAVPAEPCLQTHSHPAPVASPHHSKKRRQHPQGFAKSPACWEANPWSSTAVCSPAVHRPMCCCHGTWLGNVALYGAVCETVRRGRVPNPSDNILKRNAPPFGLREGRDGLPCHCGYYYYFFLSEAEM